MDDSLFQNWCKIFIEAIYEMFKSIMTVPVNGAKNILTVRDSPEVAVLRMAVSMYLMMRVVVVL